MTAALEENKYTKKGKRTSNFGIRGQKKHSGVWTITGKIVTVSDMYVIEVTPKLPETEIEYKDAKSIQLEDIEKLDENERLDVILYGDDIMNVIPGEIVQITGNIELHYLVKPKKPNQTKTMKVIVNATSIRYMNRKEQVITIKDIEAFERFASYTGLMNRLCTMFAPNVVGHKVVKEGLLRSIVGGDNHEQRGGGRVNTFMVGDPGTAKSTLGQEAAKIRPSSRHVSAPHASSKTITAVAEKENESITLRLGAIPLSRNAICAIDEIAAFSPEEQGRLLDILEEGIIDLDKHGRHWTIQSPATIIATANPIQSRWANSEVVSNNEVNILKTLLDRFQVFVFRDDMNEDQVSHFVGDLSRIKKRRPHNYNFLRKYLIHASTVQIRKITHEAEFMLNEFWKVGKLQSKLSIRDYIAIFSIAGIAKQTMEIFNVMLSHYGEVVKTITNPKTVSYERFLQILQDNKVAGVSVKELCRIACDGNRQINSYLGKNWSMDHNIRLRTIVDMLRNHDKVREVKRNPLVFQWDDESLSDGPDGPDLNSITKSEDRLGPLPSQVGSEVSEVSDRNIEYDKQHSSELYDCPGEGQLGEREGLKNYLGIELVNSLSNPKSNISEKEPELTGNKIYRIIPGSDRWACPDCKYTGDTWFMQKHPCRENRKRK